MLLLLILLGLGGWQLQRAEEKQRLGDAFNLRTTEAPILLNPRVDTLRPEVIDSSWWRFRRVEIAGQYESRRQYLLDNRTENGIAGYQVLTPLRLRDRDQYIMINRGWVPVGVDREILPDVRVDDRLLSLRGTIALPRQPLLLGESGYQGVRWPRVVQTVDIESIQRDLGAQVLPLVVELAADDRLGFVRHWSPTLGITPARHRGYALQWLSLALTLVVIYGVVNLKPTADAPQ